MTRDHFRITTKHPLSLLAKIEGKGILVISYLKRDHYFLYSCIALDI